MKTIDLTNSEELRIEKEFDQALSISFDSSIILATETYTLTFTSLDGQEVHPFTLTDNLFVVDGKITLAFRTEEYRIGSFKGTLQSENKDPEQYFKVYLELIVK